MQQQTYTPAQRWWASRSAPEKRGMARALGVTQDHLSAVIHGRQECSKTLANLWCALYPEVKRAWLRDDDEKA